MNLLVAIALTAGILVIGLFWVWYVLWREFYCDQYRQNLFLLRDRLFDCAHSGEIPFDSDEYKGMRDMINGTIRFAHQFSPTTILGIAIFRSKLFPDSSTDDADERLQLARENYSELYFDVVTHLAMESILYLVRSSVALRIIMSLFRLVRGTKELQTALARKIEPYMDEVGALGT